MHAPICFRKLNAKYPLHFETYDGGDEGLHPSCVFFNKGWNGYKFWFVFTPYKGMNDAIENPCIYHSNDGVHFESVPSACPLDDISLDCSMEYNSDPELVFNKDLDRLECWWRRVLRNGYPDLELRNTEIIYRRFSYDGFAWSEKEEMIREKNPFAETRKVISPSLIYKDGTYMMWCSSAHDFEGNNRTINYYELSGRGKMHLVRQSHFEKGILSHIDVIESDHKYWLIGNDISLNGAPLKLYSFAQPTDNDYVYEGIILSKGKKGYWDDRMIYRPSVVKANNEYWLYYSAYGSRPNTENHIGLIKFKNWNQLTKCFCTIRS